MGTNGATSTVYCNEQNIQARHMIQAIDIYYSFDAYSTGRAKYAAQHLPLPR